MTVWGGREVQRFAVDAGFTGPVVNQAVYLAHAASGFQDAHRLIDAGRPEHDEWGLWGLASVAVPWVRPSDLFDPRVSANALWRLWANNERSWSFHPLAVDPMRERLRTAIRLVDAGDLLNKRADEMPQPVQPIGSRFNRIDPESIMSNAGDLRPHY